jgi:5-methylcytosine-specific restriction endonuclease McrA
MGPPRRLTCSKCGLDYVGGRDYCLPCHAKYAVERRAANIEKARAKEAEYRASHREQENAKVWRWKQKAGERPCYKCGALFIGPAAYCKPCQKAYQAGWYEANKAKNKPSNANPEIRRKNKRIAEQRRRARKRSVEDAVSTDIVAKLLAKQRGCCACCKCKFTKTNYELDHIEPLAKGGRHADDNLQLLCMICNRAKAAKDPITFMQQRGFLL